MNSTQVKEYLDNAALVEQETTRDIEHYLSLQRTCAKDKYAFYIPAHCDSCGSTYGFDLTCNKEYCEVCGQTKSDAHLRRFSRWYGDLYNKDGTVKRAGMARQIKNMSYFVITFPERERDRLKEPEQLRDTRKRIISWMKKKGYHRGLSRWHWFGEQDQPGRWFKTFDNKPLYKPAHKIPDSEMKYHPHFNVLTDGFYIQKDKIRAMERELDELLGIEGVNINHHYADNDPKKKEYGLSTKVHWVMYVTRATYKKVSWEPELVSKLWNFRNTHCWGKRTDWQTEAQWSLDDIPGEVDTKERLDQLAGVDIETVSKVRQGICPSCDHQLEFGKPVSKVNLSSSGILEYFGAGVYRLLSYERHKALWLPQKIIDYM